MPIDPKEANRLPVLQEQVPSYGNEEYSDETISDYESRNGVPMTAVQLGLKDSLGVNPIVEMKVRAIDEFILQTMVDEKSRDSSSGYKNIFNRMMQSIGESAEEMVRGGNTIGLVDALFRQAALSNGLSSKTYLAEYTKRYQTQNIQKLLSQLGKALKTLPVQLAQ